MLKIIRAVLLALIISFIGYYIIFPFLRNTVNDSIISIYENIRFHAISSSWPRIKMSEIKYMKIATTSTEPVQCDLPENMRYFAAFGWTESFLLSLEGNGRYQTLMRPHFGLLIWDKGTWSKTETGFIALKSERRYRELWIDAHTDLDVDSSVIAMLPDIKVKIKGLLSKSKSDSISYGTVKAICPKIWGFYETPISRKDLMGFTEEIDHYVADSTKNVFRLKPVTYRGYVILIELDSHWHTPEEQMKSIPIKIDSISKYIPIEVYIALTPKQYQYETGHGEPFKFIK